MAEQQNGTGEVVNSATSQTASAEATPSTNLEDGFEELSGAELKELIKMTFNEEWPHLQLKGLGFRGTIMGEFVYSGIEFEEEKQKIYINGSEILPKETYKLAIPDMFTFGHFFPDLARLDKKYFMPEFLRDVLAWKLGG